MYFFKFIYADEVLSSYRLDAPIYNLWLWLQYLNFIIYDYKIENAIYSTTQRRRKKESKTFSNLSYQHLSYKRIKAVTI